HDVERRVLPRARRRDGARPGVEGGGEPPPRLHPGPPAEHRRQAGWAKTFGLPLEAIGPEEAARLVPVMSTAGVLGAVYLPTDGHLDPSGLAMALAEGARRRGASIRTGTRVVGIGVEHGRVHEVRTEGGAIRTEVVVDAAGMYAP